MTVNTATNTATYSGNGVTTVFPVPFYFLANSDLQVLQKVGATGVTHTLALGTDYVLTGAGVEAGGSLTMNVAPAGGLPPDTLYIARNVSAVQQTAYPANSPFPAASHEMALDRLTMLAQQIHTGLGLTLQKQPLASSYDLQGNTLINEAVAVNPSDVPNLSQVQTLVAAGQSGIVPANIALLSDLASTATGKGAALVGYKSPLNGAVARTLYDAQQDTLCVQDFGAKGDGVTDDTAAIALADAASRSAGKALYFPGATYMVSQLVANSTSHWVGDGRNKTIILQIIGSNKDLVYGANSNANWGQSVATSPVNGWTIIGMQFNGNWNAGTGNTSGSGLAVWGARPILRDVFFTNCAEYGMRTEYRDQSGVGTFFEEGDITNVRIDTVGKHGWLFNGPHDSYVADVIIVDAGQATANTWDGLYIDTLGNARWSGIHCWTRSTSTRMRYALNDNGGANNFSVSHFEGASSGNVRANGQKSDFSDCSLYAAWNGTNLIVKQPISFRGTISDPAAGQPASVGIVLGEGSDNASACNIDVTVFGNTLGTIDFTHDGGNNTIKVRSYQASGAGVIGSPQATDQVDIHGQIGAAEYDLVQNHGTTYQNGDILFNGSGAGVIGSINTFMTSAGTTQATATTVDALAISVLSTVSAGTGVILPAVATGAFPVGKSKQIVNLGANALLVYPAVGEQIAPLATNAAVSVAAGKSIVLVRSTSSQWVYQMGA